MQKRSFISERIGVTTRKDKARVLAQKPALIIVPTIFIEHQAKRLYEAGLRVETHIYDGDPKQVPLSAAKDLEIDCIFIGAHGLHHDAGHLSLGTVASAITARAPARLKLCALDKQQLIQPVNNDHTS